MHAHHPEYGRHAAAIAAGELWSQPQSGGHNDKAHPPIHPTKALSGCEHNWPSQKRDLYTFVVRSFLA